MTIKWTVHTCITQISTEVSCLFPFLMKLAQTSFSMWLSLHIFPISPRSLGVFWACTDFSSNIPTWNNVRKYRELFHPDHGLLTSLLWPIRKLPPSFSYWMLETFLPTLRSTVITSIRGSLQTRGKFLIFSFVQDSRLKPSFVSQHSSSHLESELSPGTLTSKH